MRETPVAEAAMAALWAGAKKVKRVSRAKKGERLRQLQPCLRVACAPAVAPARGAPGAHDGGGDGGELRARLRAAAWSRRVRVSCSSRGPAAAQRGALLGRKAAHRWCSPRGAAAPGRTRRGAAGGRRPARRPPGGRPRGGQRRAGGRRRERRRRQAPALHGGTGTVHARGAKARGSAGKRLRTLRPPLTPPKRSATRWVSEGSKSLRSQRR